MLMSKRGIVHRTKALEVFVLILAVSTTIVGGFISPQNYNYLQPIQQYQTQEYHKKISVSINAGIDNNNEEEGDSTMEVQDNFDGKGFAGYLGQYAVAFVGSIVVTLGFVKFVLMDY